MAKDQKPESSTKKMLDAVLASEAPDVDVTRPSERKQVNVPKEVLDRLEQVADATGQKLSTVAADAITIYIMLMADENQRGDVMPSRTSLSLRRLAIEHQLVMGEIVRVSTHVGLKLMEEASTQGDDHKVLLDDLVDIAETKKRDVAELVAEYVRRGIQQDLRSGGK